MLFPMYTVAADVLLKMTKVEPHEKLKARDNFGIGGLRDLWSMSVCVCVWLGCGECPASRNLQKIWARLTTSVPRLPLPTSFFKLDSQNCSGLGFRVEGC